MNEESNPRQDPVWNAAWAWVMRQHESALSETAQSELEQWLAADPAHRKTYDKANRLWAVAGLVPPVNDVDLPADDNE